MRKIAVYAGHGGSDFGATNNGYYEKDLTLEMMTALTGELVRRGYTVINNRTTDTERSIVADARKANQENVDAVIELHLNSNTGTPGTGTETYYSVTGRGKELAEEIQTEVTKLGFFNRGIKTLTNIFGGDYLGIIRLTTMPAVLVEVFFINNNNDLEKYDANAIANAIANAVQKLYPVKVNFDDTIASIQKWLNINYNTNLIADGIYGKRTRKAIITGLQTELNSQFNAGLSVDGIFGEKTKGKLVTVKRGAKGKITYLIQASLYVLGYNVIPDGIFGEKTERGIREFQRDFNLPITGVADVNTQAKLFGSI